MGKKDTERQALNVARMRLLGAEVVPVTHGSQTLKDAVNEAFRDWVANVDTTHYVLGTVTGPHPFPEMVRDFHRVIGVEARQQVLDLVGRLPDVVCACVGGGSNAMGIFHRFIDDAGVRLVGLEAGGYGHRVGQARGPLHRRHPRRPARRLHLRPAGRRRPDHRVALASPPGSTTRASGPSTPTCSRTGRAEYRPITDDEAMEAFRLLSRTEGIIPAIECATPWPARCRSAGSSARDAVLLVNLSGRGDKDVHTAARWFGLFDDEAPSRRRRREPPVPREWGSSCERRSRHRGVPAEGRAALDRVSPGRFPLPSHGSIDAMKVLVEAGVDIVEIGLPYSDPVMDGPVIQDAADASPARTGSGSRTPSRPCAPSPRPAPRSSS